MIEVGNDMKPGGEEWQKTESNLSTPGLGYEPWDLAASGCTLVG